MTPQLQLKSGSAIKDSSSNAHLAATATSLRTVLDDDPLLPKEPVHTGNKPSTGTKISPQKYSPGQQRTQKLRSSQNLPENAASKVQGISKQSPVVGSNANVNTKPRVSLLDIQREQQLEAQREEHALKSQKPSYSRPASFMDIQMEQQRLEVQVTPSVKGTDSPPDEKPPPLTLKDWGFFVGPQEPVSQACFEQVPVKSLTEIQAEEERQAKAKSTPQVIYFHDQINSLTCLAQGE